MRLPLPRRVALGLAATLLAVAACAGCGNSTGSKAAGTFTPGTPGVLTVATEQVPVPGFWEGTPGHLTGGFSYELARRLAERFGLKRVRVRVVPFDRIVKGDLGGADLAMSLITPTGERDEVLDFSAPYLDAAPTVLVRSGTDVPDLETAQELRWGAQRSTTFVSMIDTAITPDQPLAIYPDQDALLAALRAGRIDAALFDLPAAVAFANQSGGRLDVAAQLPHPEAIAAALPEGSDNVEAVSSAMRAFTSDGTVKDLLERWVGPDAADPEQNIPLLHTTRS